MEIAAISKQRVQVVRSLWCWGNPQKGSRFTQHLDAGAKLMCPGRQSGANSEVKFVASQQLRNEKLPIRDVAGATSPGNSLARSIFRAGAMPVDTAGRSIQRGARDCKA